MRRKRKKYCQRVALGFIVMCLLTMMAAVFYAHLTTKVLANHYPIVKVKAGSKATEIVFVKKKPRHWVAVHEISFAANCAIIVSEDWAFFQHGGLDTTQIKEAIKTNLKRKRYSRGASTITQQVAKNLFLSSEKTLWRKLREVLLTFALEVRYDKKKILETYFNIAQWGHHLYGIGPAALFYFKKEPIDLNAKEGAFLAMLLPNPVKNGQSFRQQQLTSYASKTVDSILGKMKKAKCLSEKDWEIEMNRSLFDNGNSLDALFDRMLL